MNRPDDAQLESLLKLAHEAESIDPPALRLLTAEPEPSAAVSEPAGRSAWWAILGAAACIAVSIAWVRWASPPAPGRGGSSGPVLAGGSAPKAKPEPRSGVVLSISEGRPGEVQCVRWAPRPEAWGDRALADISAEELQSAGLAMLCDVEARRLLVVGMQGPARDLPTDDATAAALAKCVLSAPGCSVHQGGHNTSLTCRPGGCVADSIAVRVEAVMLAGR